MNNPYATPDAVLTEPIGDHASYEPRIFAVSGRIGRMRYLAYHFTTMFILGVALGILAAVALPALFGTAAGGTAGMIVVWGLYIPLFILSLIITKRRLNDLDRSGWWSLLMLVPFVNLILGLYLVFGPGTQGPNRYGPPPAKNSVLLMIGGLLLPIVAGVGILAAVAIPAYQQYVQRAKAPAAAQH